MPWQGLITIYTDHRLQLRWKWDGRHSDQVAATDPSLPPGVPLRALYYCHLFGIPNLPAE